MPSYKISPLSTYTSLLHPNSHTPVDQQGADYHQAAQDHSTHLSTPLQNYQAFVSRLLMLLSAHSPEYFMALAAHINQGGLNRALVITSGDRDTATLEVENPRVVSHDRTQLSAARQSSQAFVHQLAHNAVKLQNARVLLREKTFSFVLARGEQRPGKNEGTCSLFSESFKTDIMSKALSAYSPFPEHAQVLFRLYEYFSNGEPRQIHGIAHVCRVALWVEKWYALYQKYDKNFTLTNEELRITQLAALWHDSARENDGVDQWDNDSATFFFTYLVADMQLPVEQAKEYAELIANKDHPPDESQYWRIDWNEETGSVSWNKLRSLPLEQPSQRVQRMRILLHDADCLDIIRCKPNFDKSYLYFYRQFEDNISALRELEALYLKARRVIFLMGDLAPFEDPNTASGFNQPICGHLVSQIFNEHFDDIQDLNNQGYYVRSITDPTRISNCGEFTSAAECEISKSLVGNQQRSCSWIAPGVMMFSRVGLLLKDPKTFYWSPSDADTGYGDDKYIGEQPMSEAQKIAAKERLEMDRLHARQSQYRPGYTYNEVIATIEKNDISGIVYTLEPTLMDNTSCSLLDAMYVQSLVYRILDVKVPIYEYSGIQMSMIKRYEDMVSEEQAIMAFHEKIWCFFNSEIFTLSDQQAMHLFTTDDPEEMKCIIFYGHTHKIPRMSQTSTPFALSSPDQFLTQADQDQLTQLIIIKKWRYIIDNRIPMIQRKVREELQPKLSCFDIKMIIAHQKEMEFDHEKITDITKYVIKEEFDTKSYTQASVKASPLFHFIMYLTSNQGSQSQYLCVLIETFKEIIKSEYESHRPSIIPSEKIHIFCQKSRLIENEDIANLLKNKRNHDLEKILKQFRKEEYIGHNYNLRKLCAAVKIIEHLFKTEAQSGQEIDSMIAIQDMKEKLSDHILNSLNKDYGYIRRLEQYVHLWSNNGALCDIRLYKLMERLNHFKGNEMHALLLESNTAIFTSGTPVSLDFLMKTINSFDQDTPGNFDYKLVFNISSMLAQHELSIFDILNQLVQSNKQFMENNIALWPWFLEKSQRLWLSKVQEQNWSNIDSLDKAVNIIKGVISLRAQKINDDIFLKIASVFPSGPCEGFIDAALYLVKNGNQACLGEIFCPRMKPEHIKMIKRVISVPAVGNNEVLREKIAELLKLNPQLPYFVEECLSRVMGLNNGNALPPNVSANMSFFANGTTEAPQEEGPDNSCRANSLMT